MDFQRLLLVLIFSFSVFLLWDGWERAQHPSSVAALTATTPEVLNNSAAPVLNPTSIDTSPSAPLSSIQAVAKIGKRIYVKTDVISLQINSIGGDIQRLDLLDHRAGNEDNKPFTLLQKRDSGIYITQTGLLGSGMPSHDTEYSSVNDHYELKEGDNSIQVSLTALIDGNTKVFKTYTLHRGSYLIDITYEISNGTSSSFAPTAYFQLVRDDNKIEGESKFVPTYLGPAVFTDEKKFQKVDFSEIEKGKVEYPKSADNGWIGMLQHYFVAAWIPEEKSRRDYYTKVLDKHLYAAGVLLPVSVIQPNSHSSLKVSLYAGPAKSSLDSIAPGLGLSVDYGWLTIIATPLFWLLSQLYSWVLNWGLAIIILTVLIKLLFFPLSAASYRSMAKMRLVAPKLEKIKQQYGDDRERLHKAMMELYQTEKINPLGGCLPILIQIPVFISLYWAILASVELRHAPFFGWITDLSSPDPYYVLPLIMGASMVLQSKLNPTPPDPLQAKIMQIMPIVFGFVFFFFPAGLVLYSVVNNILSIAQQWFITRGAERSQNKGATA